MFGLLVAAVVGMHLIVSAVAVLVRGFALTALPRVARTTDAWAVPGGVSRPDCAGVAD